MTVIRFSIRCDDVLVAEHAREVPNEFASFDAASAYVKGVSGRENEMMLAAHPSDLRPLPKNLAYSCVEVLRALRCNLFCRMVSALEHEITTFFFFHFIMRLFVAL